MVSYKKQLELQDKKRFYSYTDFRDHLFLFFAKPLSIIFFKLGLKANYVTILSGLSSIIGGLFLTSEKPIYLFSGMIFFIIFYLLDYCDGIVARLRNEQSIGGQYFDLIMHIVNGVSFGMGISLGSILTDGREYIPFAILTVISLSLTLSRFSIGWMAIAMKICEDIKINKNNEDNTISVKQKKPLLLKFLTRFGSILFHEDYFIFTVSLLLFLNIFYGGYLPIDVRTILIIYGAIIYFPAMLLETIFYSDTKLDKIFKKFSRKDKNFLLPDFIFFNDNN